MPHDRYEKSTDQPLCLTGNGPRFLATSGDLVCWRRLWVALAEAERETGAEHQPGSRSTSSRPHVDNIDFKAAAAYERKLRHDVMGSRACVMAMFVRRREGIIHLGATSCYITDNADLILMREGLQQLGPPAGCGHRSVGPVC